MGPVDTIRLVTLHRLDSLSEERLARREQGREDEEDESSDEERGEPGSLVWIERQRGQNS